MKAFTVHTGLVVPLDRPNVDTDAIMPKEFLGGIARAGYGRTLFYNWRYLADGSPNPEFTLNRPEYAGATVLVAGRNFGCGSSREHAVWALQDFGFQVVIAPYFADIFYNNCFKAGLLPVALPEPVVGQIMERAVGAGYQLTVDLEHCVVRDGHGLQISFQVDPYRREALLSGLDEIGMTLRYETEIATFEERR